VKGKDEDQRMKYKKVSRIRKKVDDVAIKLCSAMGSLRW
jgi:hypothetical protein